MSKVVLYHANCNDGILSAAIVSLFEKDPTVVYHPVTVNGNIPKIPKDAEVILADISFSDITKMYSLLERSKHLTVVEHRADTLVVLNELAKLDPPNLEIIFDSDDTGCGLMWKWYTSNPMPKVVSMVRNYDLHNHKTHEDECFHYGAMTEPSSVSFWESLLEDERKVYSLIGAGRHICKFLTNTVLAQIRTRVAYTSIMGMAIPIVNVSRTIQDAVVAELISVSSVVIAYEDLGNGKRKWSVRSSPLTAHGYANKIAKTYGGGGSPNASGFITDDTFMLNRLNL